MALKNVDNIMDIYREAMSKATQIPCTLKQSDIREAHKQIINELKDKFQFQDQVMENELLSTALESNSKKKTQFLTSEMLDSDYEILDGEDNFGALCQIKHWLCNFPKEERYCVNGYLSEVGASFDEVCPSLSISSSFSALMRSGIFVSKKLKEPELTVGRSIYVSIEPISAKLHLCSPESVSGDVRMESYKAIYELDGVQRELNLPEFKARDKLNATAEATIEYSVAKEVDVRRWAKLLSVGILSAWNNKGSETFTHKMKLLIKCDQSVLKIREKFVTDISTEAANNFNKKCADLKQLRAKEPFQKHHQSAAKGRNALFGFETNEPWVQFVQELRNGGVKAAMEMLKKKPDTLNALLTEGYPNEVLGITFEELQIAKVMAEVRRRRAPIELYAGDGNGKITLKNHVEMKTPEYTDAVFHNTETGEYFAVQFKYTDSKENLVNMVTEWRKRWCNNLNKDDMLGKKKLFPQALELDNVYVIGPKDLLSEGAAQSMINIGFDIDSDSVEAVQKFFDENKEILREFLQDEEMKATFKNIKTKSEKIKEYERLLKEVDELKKGLHEVSQLEARLKSLEDLEQQKRQGKARDAFDIDEGKIEEYQRRIDEKKYELIDKPKNLQKAEESLLKLKQKRAERKALDECKEKHNESLDDPEWKSIYHKEEKKNQKSQSQYDSEINNLQKEIEKLRVEFTEQQRQDAFKKTLPRRLEAKEIERENQRGRYEQLKKEVAHLNDKAKKWLEQRVSNPAVQTECLKFAVAKIGQEAAVGAIVDGILSMAIACDEEIRLCLAGDISSSECAIKIVRKTATGAARGGCIAGALATPAVLGQICKSVGYTGTGTALAWAGNILGPAALCGTFGYSIYQILRAHTLGHITEAEKNKQLCRLTSTTMGTVGGSILPTFLIGGPLGITVGAGIAISIVLGDHFLGDKLWSLAFREDKAELEALQAKRKQQLEQAVLHDAYKLLNLSKYCSDDELRDAVKAAKLKYHPDKGGDNDVFVAVHLASEVIQQSRKK